LRIVFLKFVFAAFVLLVAGCVSPRTEESTVGDYLSGRLAARTNDVSVAADAFTGAQMESPGASKLLRDAFFFQLAAGNFAKAMPLAEKLAGDSESGDDGLAKVALAAREMKHGRYQSARDVLARGVEASYFAATVKIIDAWAVSALDGPEASFKMLVGASSAEFKGFNPLHMALLADKAGRPDEALAAHQLSVMTFGGGIGRSAYGAFLERSGDVDAAREYYELLTQDTGAERQLALQALARIDAGKVSNAYADVSPAEGASIALYTLAGAILQQTSNQRAAAVRAGFNVGDVNYNLPLLLTRLSLYLNPSLDDARRFAGSILNIYGDHKGAIAILKDVAPSSPYYEQSLIEIARALASQEKTKEAVSLLRTALRRAPEALELRLSLASLEASQDNHAAAVRILDDLIARLPEEIDEDAWRYFIARAVSLLELDDWPRAERDLRRAVEIGPEEATALNYLGYSWVERGLNLDEAFGLIEKAVSLQPSSGAIIDSLGWAYYQRGDYDTAVGHLEQAAALEPGDPTVTDHLGDVYWRLGRKLEARYQWRRALELEPSDEQIQSINAKLEDGLPDTDR
jgi:tetratricopeptide (TPR) repeat protein